MKLWKADSEQWKAIAVECPDGHLGFDVDGCKVYLNTHFETEEAAWVRLNSLAMANISTAGSKILQIESDLREAQRQSAEAVKAYELLQRNRLRSDRS